MATAHFVHNFKMRGCSMGISAQQYSHPPWSILQCCNASQKGGRIGSCNGGSSKPLQMNLQAKAPSYCSHSLALLFFCFVFLLNRFFSFAFAFCLLPALRTEVSLTRFLSGFLLFAPRYFMSFDRHLFISPWRWFVGAPPLILRV